MHGGRLALAALVALAAASPASAATVWNNQKAQDLYELTVRGSPGEANDVSVSGPGDGQWSVRDGGAPLTTREGCQSVDANSARCSAAQSFGVLLVLEDGDDRASFATSAGLDPVPPAKVYGGDGDDTLSTGGEGQQDLDGGVGNDTLTKTGGEREYFYGGPGDDRIRTVDEPGHETEGDVVICDEGADVVEADQFDTVEPDCESVTRTEIRRSSEGGEPGGGGRRAEPSIPRLPARGLKLSAAGSVAVPVACSADGGTCRDGRVTVRRRGGPVLGRAGFDLPAGGKRAIRVPLTAGGRRAVRRAGTLRATITVAVGGTVVRRSVTLRR